jgi:hypothetical protein
MVDQLLKTAGGFMERMIVVTQEELDTFNKAQMVIVKRVHALNPLKPRPRSSDEIKLDIRRLVGEAATNVAGDEGVLPRWKRLLAEKQKFRDEARAAIKRTEQTITELRASGAGDRHQRIQQLIGYKYFSKTFQREEFVPGTLQDLQEELGKLEVCIVTLRTAVETTQKRVNKELPQLEAELRAALKAESLQ